MDANGLRSWMLADRELARAGGARPRYRPDWLVEDPELSRGVEYCQRRRCLRLESVRPVDFASDRAAAEAALAAPPRVVDLHGCWAEWVEGEAPNVGVLRANGAFPDAPPIGVLELERPHDLALGFDGRLYAAVGTTLRVVRLAELVDLDGSDRPSAAALLDTRTDAPPSLQGFQAQSIAPRAQGGAWLLERDSGRLALLEVGEDLPAARDAAPEVFRPPARASLRIAAVDGARLPADEEAIALATGPDGALALLSWNAADESRLRVLGPERSWSEPSTLAGVPFAYALAWMDAERIAVLVAGAREALVFRWDAGRTLVPIGDRHPLVEHDARPFLQGPLWPPRYGTRAAPDGRPRTLRALSLPTYARKGSSAHSTPDGQRGRMLDSGETDTVWHRLYIEARVPAGTGLCIELATDGARGDEPLEWHPHLVGDVPDAPSYAPRAALLSFPSELPFERGLFECEERDERSGCFSVLVQRPTKRVRALRGRRLHVRVHLFGDSRTTPELYALRAYASRFSYVANYLPELYRETLFGPEADEGDAAAPATSTPADFLERFVANFEGLLTPLEDRIAAAHHLMTPSGVPADSLAWLGAWSGLSLEESWDEPIARSVLARAAELGAWHGTRRGLELLTDLVLPGSVAGGRVVFLEEWQLRRTFATILGADLADEQDPLVGALSVSGNSIVGDTLILGTEERAELFALYRDEVELDESETEAVLRFFDERAHRLLVVVASDLSARELGLLERVLELEVPAHVRARIAPISQRLLVGLSSIVGIDTRLEAAPRPGSARVNASTVGRGDRIVRPASLDPRLQGDVR